MTKSEQARAAVRQLAQSRARRYWCSDCNFEVSSITRWWHQHEGHHTHGPLESTPEDSWQARADAMADAETLRRVALSVAVSGPLTGCALWLIRAVTSGDPHYWRQPYETARKHARAAFRAAPGLRGDK